MAENPPKDYVVGFLFSEDMQGVALIEKRTKNKPEQRWQDSLLNGIGGKIEDGEMPEDAMRREFLEEAGLPVEHWRLFCLLRWRESIIYFFTATGDLNALRSMEEEQIRRVPVDHLGGYRIVPNLAWLVPMAADQTNLKAEVTQHE